jgi:hypothetical protein
LRALAIFSLSTTGEIFELGPGETIGRSHLAGMCIEDPRVSEAHALLSLRGDALMLLPLRGRFRVDQKVATEIILEAGMRVELAPDIEIECLEVIVPPILPGIEVPGLPPFVPVGTTSVWLDPVRIARGYHGDANVVFWAVGTDWKATVGPTVHCVEPGLEISFGDQSIRILETRLRESALTRTRQVLKGSVTWRPGIDAVRLQSVDRAPVTIGGVPGRILNTLLRVEPSMHWHAIAAHVWPGDASMEQSLRKRFDVGLLRLRDRLSTVIEDELITLNGHGMVTLQLRPHDVVELEP